MLDFENPRKKLRIFKEIMSLSVKYDKKKSLRDKNIYKEIIKSRKGLSDKHWMRNKTRNEACKITCKFHAKQLLEIKEIKATQIKLSSSRISGKLQNNLNKKDGQGRYNLGGQGHGSRKT